MSEKSTLEIIDAAGVCPPQGLYSHAVAAGPGKVLYLAGQVAVDENNQLVGPDDFRRQMRQVFTNLGRILESGGSSFDRIVKYTTYLVRAGGLVLNRATRTVCADEREIELSTTEFKILKALMEHANRVLNRDQLMNLARGRDFMAFDRSIDVHISKLRAKVESDPGSPKRIKTVWGTGYMFVDAK